MSNVVVLGAGPAGLAAALELATKGVDVTLIEKESYVGGNASSFTVADMKVDYGSHRLHPAADDQVLNRIRELLGDDLLTRPRHGRINLMGKWIHFPLRPVDLLLRGKASFTVGVLKDLAGKVLPSRSVADESQNFATVLQKGLGKTICSQFYFPYAKKIWGLDPEELSAIQAYKRVSSGTIGKMIKRLLPWTKSTGGANTKGIFYYPRHGFGQISEAYHQAAINAGVNIMLDSTVRSLSLNNGEPEVVVENSSGQTTIKTDQIYSTIPVTILARLIESTPESIKEQTGKLRFRSMVLVYLQLDADQFTEYDAHYFPGEHISFTRISEPKNYSDLRETDNSTVLCVEMPCFFEDEIWNQSGELLKQLIVEDLKKINLPISSEVTSVHTKRIQFAYPLYTTGYEENFNTIDSWLSQQKGLLTFGRQGLYAHDNTHHAIFMAMKASECLDENGQIDIESWKEARRLFEQHVVED